MHGEQETSFGPRLVWILLHALIVFVAGWFLVFDGCEIVFGRLGIDVVEGHAGRRAVLLAFGIGMWIRMTFGALLFLKRRFDWGECLAVTAACAVYQFGFAVAGVGTAVPLGWFDLPAVFLYLAGSGINTFAELERNQFKQDPAHRDQLYTGGLFAVVQHPNYSGDIMWLIGWALLTLNPWAFLLPGLATAGFVFFFIPTLGRYLQARYGAAYERWSARTAKLVPRLY